MASVNSKEFIQNNENHAKRVSNINIIKRLGLVVLTLILNILYMGVVL